MIFDPIFSLISLAVLVYVALAVFTGHADKLKRIIETGDEGELRKFTTTCCNAHRWHVLVMALGMTIMVLFSMSLGMVVSALGVFVIDRFGQFWFFQMIGRKISSLLPTIKFPW